MFGFKSLAFASAAVFLAAPVAVAQVPQNNFTQAQVQACAVSISMPDYPTAGFIYYDVSNTATFSTRFAYDVARQYLHTSSFRTHGVLINGPLHFAETSPLQALPSPTTPPDPLPAVLSEWG